LTDDFVHHSKNFVDTNDLRAILTTDDTDEHRYDGMGFSHQCHQWLKIQLRFFGILFEYDGSFVSGCKIDLGFMD
jgi:hypothetical protein